MKVLLTHERFLPDSGGGGEWVVFHTARSLRDRGIEVKVLTTGDPSVRYYEGIETVRLPISRYRMQLATASIARAAAGFDLIHTFNYHACLPSLRAARRIGKPVVCTILGLFSDAWLEMRGPILGRAWREFERFMLRQPFDLTCFLSSFSRDEGLLHGARPDCSAVTSPGVDLGRLYAEPNKTQVILFIGKFSHRKGINDILEVARRVPEAKFRLLGWSPEAEVAKSLAARPDNVMVIDDPPGTIPFHEYAQASIFLFPSYAETFGLVVPEAMASGCAVISSIPHGFAGELVRAGDLDAITAAVRKLWHDPALVQRLGKENRLRATHFDWALCAERIETCYTRLLRGLPVNEQILSEGAQPCPTM